MTPMTLHEFRLLSEAEQRQWVAGTIIAQHPRLRRGDDALGPVGLFLNGKTWGPENEIYADDQITPIGPRAFPCSARSLTASFDQLIGGHPFLDIPVKDENYLHMYQVEVRSAFGERVAGDKLTVIHNNYPITIALTQEMIDDSTVVFIRCALSK